MTTLALQPYEAGQLSPFQVRGSKGGQPRAKELMSGE